MLTLRRRRVRVHQDREGPTIEGILVNSWSDHYRLLQPVVIETPDRSHPLTGEVWIPRERVVLVEHIR